MGATVTASIRLAPLVETLSGEQRAKSNVARILERAARGEATLYVAVPPGAVVYADHLRPGVGKGSSSGHPPSISLQAQREVDSDRRKGLPVIAYPVAQPEVAFLALASSAATELLAASITKVHWFASGLASPDKSELGQQGYMRPRRFFSALCLRGVGPSQIGTSIVRGPLRGSSPENALRLTLRDIYVDEYEVRETSQHGSSPPTAAATPVVSNPLLSHDPHGLKSRALGVFIMYAVARTIYPPHLKSGTTKLSREEQRTLRAQAEKQLFENGPKDLYSGVVVGHIAKLIDPYQRRGSGSDKKKVRKRPFDANLLDDPEFKARYMNEGFETKALALVIYATDWWRKLQNTIATRNTVASADQFSQAVAYNDHQPTKKKSQGPKQKLREQLEKLGFYGDEELTALVKIITRRSALVTPDTSTTTA